MLNDGRKPGYYLFDVLPPEYIPAKRFSSIISKVKRLRFSFYPCTLRKTNADAR